MGINLHDSPKKCTRVARGVWVCTITGLFIFLFFAVLVANRRVGKGFDNLAWSMLYANDISNRCSQSSVEISTELFEWFELLIDGGNNE